MLSKPQAAAPLATQLTLATALLASGCGSITVGPEVTPPPDEAPARASGEATRLKAAYDAFASSGRCFKSNPGLCAHELREAAQITKKPHREYDPIRMWNPRSAPNPDPTWIAGWDSLPTSDSYNEADQVFQVIADALIRRAARKTCEEGFKARYDELKKADDALGVAIDAASKEPTAHDRVNALVAVRRTAGAKAVGAPFRVEQELRRQFAGERRLDAFAWLRVGSPQAPELRPLLALETEARAHCLTERVTYFDDEKKALSDELSKAKSLTAAPSGAKATPLSQELDFKPPFFGSDRGKLVSVRREGVGGVIVYETTRDDTFVTGCRETNDRLIVQGGTVKRDTSCKYGTVTFANTVTLKFEDLPKVQLDKGDELELVAWITEHQVKTINKSPTKRRVERKFAGDGLYVVSVSRDSSRKWKLVP